MPYYDTIPPMVMGTAVFDPVRQTPFLPGDLVIGTCSKCRGPVCVPSLWGSVVPATPTCRGCGAHKRAEHGPVIEME